MHLARAAELADALLVVVGTDTRLTLVRARIGLALRRPPERLGGLLKAREERIGSVRSRSRGSSTGTGSMCSDGTGNSTCQRKDGLCAVGTRIVVHAAECMGSGANTGAGRSSTRARSVAKATGEGFVRVEKCAILALPFRRSTTSHMRCSTATYWPFSTPTAPGGGDWATSRCNSGQGRPSCGSIPYLAHRRQERRDSERLERLLGKRSSSWSSRAPRAKQGRGRLRLGTLGGHHRCEERTAQDHEHQIRRHGH